MAAATAAAAAAEGVAETVAGAEEELRRGDGDVDGEVVRAE